MGSGSVCEKQRFVHIQGVVRDEGHRVVPGAILRKGVCGYAYRADAEGRFDIAVRYYYSRAKGPLYARSPTRNLAGSVMPRPEANHIDIQLSAAASVIGRVVDTQGKPIPEAIVGSRDSGAWLASDANGFYRIVAMRVGSADVFASAPQHETSSTSTEITDANGIAKAEDIVLKLADGRVSGMVVDQGGKPVPGVYVGSWPYTDGLPCAISDANGLFVIRGLVRGGVTITAEDEFDEHGDEVKANTGDTNIRIVAGRNKTASQPSPTKAPEGDDF